MRPTVDTRWSRITARRKNGDRASSAEGVADDGVVSRSGPRGGDPEGGIDPATAPRPRGAGRKEDETGLSPIAGRESPIAGEDIRKDLRELREQIESLRDAFATVARPYSELVGYIEQLQGLSRGYLRLLDLVQRFGGVSPGLAVPELKDDISRHIVTALLEKGERNISQITDAVKARRGTASRRIVRQRLEDLVRRGFVVVSQEARNRTFRISEAVERRWSQLLGFPKYEDTPAKDTTSDGDRDE